MPARRRATPRQARRRACRPPSAGRRSRTCSAPRRTASSRCASTHSDSHAEQPRELAGVRRQHGRGRALDRLELVERVGIDDRRQVDLREQPPHELLRPVAAAEPGPERERAGLRANSARLDGPRRDRAVSSGQGRLTASSSRCSKTGSGWRGHGDRDVARVGAERSLGGEAGRAGQPARAADDEHGARRCTCCVGAAARERGPGSRRVTSACLVSACSRPMSATTISPAWKRPGATSRPTFWPWNVTVTVASTQRPRPRRSRR